MAAKIRVSRGKSRYQKPDDKHILKAVADAAESIRGLTEKLEQETGKRRTDTYKHMVDLFTGDHELGLDDSKRYVNFDFKGEKPADVILRVMGMLSVPPQFQFIGPEGNSEDDKEAGKMEQHINALYPWYLRNRQRGAVKFTMKNRFWQLLLGVGYIQQSFAPYVWDKDELKRRESEKDNDAGYNRRVEGYRRFAGPPIEVEALDPRTVFPLVTPFGTKVYCKHYRVQRYDFDIALARRGKRATYKDDGTVAEVGAMRGKAEMRGVAGEVLPVDSTAPPDSSIDYYEYLDDEWCYYVVDNQVVDSYHHQGAMRIFPAFCFQTGFAEAHLQSVGLLWTVRNTIPQYDYLRTLWANKGYLSVFPQLFAELGDNDDPLLDENSQPKEWTLEPGTVKQVRGRLHNALAEGGTMPDFQALVQEYATGIDLATISNLMRGMAGAQQAGYSINQLVQAARSAWKPAIESSEEQMAAMAEHYLEMKRTVGKGEDWSVYAETEDSDTGRRRGTYTTINDVPDYFRVECRLNPDLPIDQQGNMLTWSKMYAEGNATFEEMTREGFNKTNVRARKRQLMREALEKAVMPKVVEDAMALGRTKLGNNLLKAAGLDQLNTTFGMDLQALKAARAGDQPGTEMMGPGGAPAAPGAPMPPLAQPQVPGGNGLLPADQQGGGIQPTVGANPANPTPGPRLQ